ncbi:MAG: DUF547 domain-containing protein [Myxococcota bacterium]
MIDSRSFRIGWRTAALLALAAPALGSTQAGSLDLALYGRLLEEYTVETPATVGTAVDYTGLARSAAWRKLIFQLGRARPERVVDRRETLAFWINAYNILAIQVVLDHYPVDSIRDIGSFLRPVWKREAGRVAGEPVTLHAVEHEILRKLGEPRIHAAIVCASTSCPSLARTPYTARGLDAELAAATRGWLASPSKGAALDRTGRSIRLSRIFDWFEEDFDAGGGVLAFVADHLPADDAAWLRQNATRVDVEYFDYDWTLNDAARVASDDPRN